MKIKFIDLFAGIGGIRKGFELACEKKGLESECVFTSEIKGSYLQLRFRSCRLRKENRRCVNI